MGTTQRAPGSRELGPVPERPMLRAGGGACEFGSLISAQAMLLLVPHQALGTTGLIRLLPRGMDGDGPAVIAGQNFLFRLESHSVPRVGRTLLIQSGVGGAWGLRGGEAMSTGLQTPCEASLQVSQLFCPQTPSNSFSSQTQRRQKTADESPALKSSHQLGLGAGT